MCKLINYEQSRQQKGYIHVTFMPLDIFKYLNTETALYFIANFVKNVFLYFGLFLVYTRSVGHVFVRVLYLPIDQVCRVKEEVKFHSCE